MTTDAFYRRSPEVQAAALRDLGATALPAWGIPATTTLDLVTERENAVFRLEHDGARYALRVHRAGYHRDDELRAQVVWARALEADGVVHTAPVVDTRAGAPFTHAAHPAVPEERQVSLLGWIDGTPLAQADGDHDTELGALMARLHDHAGAWERPADFVTLRWDADGLLGDDATWGRFWEIDEIDTDDEELLASFRARARNELDAFGTGADDFGLIHGDFLPENLLVTSDGLTLLDFDDSGEGWHLFDIATALAIAWLEGRYDSARDAFVAGYREVRALDDARLCHLPLFLALRAATYAAWMHTRAHTQYAQDLGGIVTSAAIGLVRSYMEE